MIFRYGIKCRRLSAAVFVFIICFMLVLWTNDNDVVSNNIFNAIRLSTESVTLPNEDTVLVQPWKSKSCQNSGTSHYLLFMIISSPENFEHRKIIREVIRLQLPRWEKTVISYPGSQNKMDATIKALFFVGQPANSSKESMGEKLYSEAITNGDMVHDNFHESYLNLTVKTLRMLKWVGKNCENIRYLVKLDDDVYLNVPALLNFLHQTVVNKNSENLIAGFKYNKIKIDSNPNSKWYTPPHTMWEMDRFPDFVSGICYVLGSRARKDLYVNALTTKLFHLEDVFLTGIVREKYLAVDVVHIPGIHVGWFLNEKVHTFPCDFVEDVVAVHSLSAVQVGCYNKLRDYCETKFLSWLPVLLLC